MKIRPLHFILLFVAWCSIPNAISASEIADVFAKQMPKMASDNQDEKKNAQQDWQKICREKSADSAAKAEAVKLMLDALQDDILPVDTTVWLLRMLGTIGDDSAVPTLGRYLDSKEIRCADEAARALANLPGNLSTETLKKHKSSLAQTALREQTMGRTRTLPGNETRMPMAIPYADAKDVDAWMKGYADQTDLEKAQTIANLGKRRDPKYVSYVLEAMKSEDPSLRNAAALALGAMGSSRQVQPLLDELLKGPSRDCAKLALVAMNDRTLDVRLLSALEKETDNGNFEQIADVLRLRNNKVCLPVMMNRIKQEKVDNRVQIARIAENLASREDAPGFVDAWEVTTDRGQKDQMEQIIANLVEGDSSYVMSKRNDKNYVPFFSLLGRIGDEKSLEEIRALVQGKSAGANKKSTPEMKAAALRALWNWPDGRVLDDLFAIAQDQSFSEQDRISALRGFIRIVPQPNDRIRININDQQRIERLQEAMKIATRDDEKRFIIQRMGQIRQVDSLRFVMQYLDQDAFRDQACQSVVDLAHHNDLRRRDLKLFNEALDQVLKISKNDGLKDRAKRYREAN